MHVTRQYLVSQFISYWKILFIVYLHNLKLPTRVTLHLDSVFIGMSHKFGQTEYKLNILLEKSPEDQLAHLWSHMIHDWQNVIKKKQQTVKVSHDVMVQTSSADAMKV